MDAPLGRSIGNALEIAECIAVLNGCGPDDLAGVVVRLASRMLVLAGVESDAGAATARVTEALSSGRALATFRKMVERQGGDTRVIDDPARLPAAPAVEPFRAPRAGIISAMRAAALGHASNVLGAGRTRVDEPVDHAVGIVVLAKPGDTVAAGQPLLELHHRDGRGLDAALALCAGAVAIGDTAPPPRRKVLDEIR
jgi:thymidine phosphorylase